MASISSVSIRNFRAYHDVEVDFSEPTGVYLLSGDNGAGKSTFLNAINWCLYGDTPFYSIEKYESIVTDTAPDDVMASVELYADINAQHYAFRRTTQKHQSAIGSLVVQRANSDGSWEKLDRVATLDAVRRVLPQEIRHLFFFNGEQLRDIYTGGGKEHSLKKNVYKVSEIDVLDNTINHLRELEDKILRRIKKANKNQEKIETLRQNIISIEATIKSNQEGLEKYKMRSTEIKQKIQDLDAQIRDTKDARLLIERRNNLSSQIDNYKRQIDEQSLDKQDLIRENFHRAILHDKFYEYREALVKANEDSTIPPPIDPKITSEILRTGVCICGEPLSEEARKRIETQNSEYNRMKDLQYLTDGISQFVGIDLALPDKRYELADITNKLRELESKKQKCETELKSVQEQLEKFDTANLPENPEISRSQYMKELEISTTKALALSNTLSDNESDLKHLKSELSAIIRKDTATQKDETLRQRAGELREYITKIKMAMEQIIREKLRNQTWKTFSNILPESEFVDLNIDESYNISLVAADGLTRSVSLASTGEVKALGLSLVSALSADLGYSDAPLLIDNLYGDLSEAHFSELTQMVSALSATKQIIIMNLDIQRVESEFNDSVVKGRFQIIKNPQTGTEITEYNVS